MNRAPSPLSSGGEPPLRVLIVNSLLSGGGTDTQTLSLCQALRGEGCEVTLVAPTRARWLAAARALPGLRVLDIAAKRIFWAFRLPGLIRRTQADIVHAHHGRDYWIAIVGNLLSGRRAAVVVTRHLITPLREKTRRYLAPNASLIAVSDATVNALRACDPQRTLDIHRVHCGIDTDFFRARPERRAQERARLGLTDGDMLFALVGGVQPPEGKGQFYFIEAAGRLHAQHPHAHFMCVGVGSLVPELQSRAAALGLAQNFHMETFSDDLVGLLQAVDVLVHPPVGTEALGLVILEALSCGKPVIGTRLDGIPETFVDGQHGLLVPPRDVEALTRAMAELAADPARACAMGRAARPWVESRFSLRALGAHTVGAYRAILARHRRSAPLARAA